MSALEVVVIVLGSITVLAFVAYVITTRDPRWRGTRIGVFVERERFDEEKFETGWDEDDTVEIEPLRYQRRKFPEEEGK